MAFVLFGMECYHLHEECLASFGRVVVLLDGRGSIDIDLDYCWAEAGVGWIWICAGGQAVSPLSGGEACEELDELRTAYGYNSLEMAFKKGLINSPVFWEYYSKGSLR